MQVQMQVTHRTLPPGFQATKEPGRDLSGQHFGLWRQRDPSGSPLQGFGAWSGFEKRCKTMACQGFWGPSQRQEARLQRSSMRMPS